MKNGLDERIEVGVLWWFDHVGRMERDRIVRRVYVEDRAGSHSVGRPRKKSKDIYATESRKISRNGGKVVWYKRQ